MGIGAPAHDRARRRHDDATGMRATGANTGERGRRNLKVGDGGSRCSELPLRVIAEARDQLGRVVDATSERGSGGELLPLESAQNERGCLDLVRRARTGSTGGVA